MESSIKGWLGISPNDADELEDLGLCLCFWSAGGHRFLKTGDRLTIYDKNDPSVILWFGTLAVKLAALCYEELAWTEKGDVVFPPPPGIEAATWLKWFQENYPAELICTKEELECLDA